MRQHATLLGLVLALLLPGELHALDDAMRWRTAFLDKSGEMYWWRPGFDSNDPEVAFTEPDDIWKYGQTEAGSPYIWRTDPRGKPEVQMWRRAFLDSGAPYWWRTTKGTLQDVRLKDPYELVGSNDDGMEASALKDEL